MQQKRIKFVFVAVLVLCLAIAATGCRKKSQSAELGLKPGTASASTQSPSSSAGSTSTAEDPKSPSSTTTTSTTGNGSNTSGSGGTGTGSGSGGTGSGGSGSTGGGSGGTGSGDSGTKPTPVAKGMLVKILWWNDTENKTPSGCEIVYGSSAFKPAVAKEAVSGSVGPVPFGKASLLVIYPDGRDGKKIVVPFVVDSAMSANSDRDAIHVEVSDTSVRVLGNAVDGFDKTYDRF